MMRNLAVGGVSGASCVLIPPGYERDLPKKALFDDNDPLMSKCRLIRLKKRQFWNPNRKPGTRQKRWGIGKGVIRPENVVHKKSCRFATILEAVENKFLGTIQAAYGLTSQRRHQGERSRNDLISRWESEMAAFRARDQPIQHWATLKRQELARQEVKEPETVMTSMPMAPEGREEPRILIQVRIFDFRSMGTLVCSNPRLSSCVSREIRRAIVVSFR
jgi:hypothetical protein